MPGSFVHSTDLTINYYYLVHGSQRSFALIGKGKIDIHVNDIMVRDSLIL